MSIQSDSQTLAALDWRQYRCQCPRHDCKRPALYIVEIHALDRCDEPGLSPFGNRVELRCEHCTASLRDYVFKQLGELSRWGRAMCTGCGAPIAAVSDVIRSVRGL